MGPGKGPSGRGDRGGAGPAELLEEAGPSEAEQEAIGAAGRGEREDVRAGLPEEAEAPTEPAKPGEGPTGDGAGPAPRLRRKKTEATALEGTPVEDETEAGTALAQTTEGATEDTQGPQVGTAKLSLQGSADQGSYQNGQPEFRIHIPSLKTPKFRVAKETVTEYAEGTAPVRWGPWWTQVSADDAGAMVEDDGDTESKTASGRPTQQTKPDGEGEEEAAEDGRAGDQDLEDMDGKTRTLKIKLPSFGWSPAKESRGVKTTHLQETEKEKQTTDRARTTETERK